MNTNQKPITPPEFDQVYVEQSPPPEFYELQPPDEPFIPPEFCESQPPVAEPPIVAEAKQEKPKGKSKRVPKELADDDDEDEEPRRKLDPLEREVLKLQQQHHEEEMEKQDEVISKMNKLQTALEDSHTAIIVGRQRVKPLNQFVMLFYANLRQIIEEHDLNTTTLKVLLMLIEKMEYGNLVQLKQSALAKEMGMQRQNINRAFRTLKDIGLLLELETGIYVNPHVITKGELVKFKYDEKGHCTATYNESEKKSIAKEIKPSF